MDGWVPKFSHVKSTILNGLLSLSADNISKYPLLGYGYWDQFI